MVRRWLWQLCHKGLCFTPSCLGACYWPTTDSCWVFVCCHRSINNPTEGGFAGWATGYPRASSAQLCGVSNTTIVTVPSFDWTNADCNMKMVFMCRIVREWLACSAAASMSSWHCAGALVGVQEEAFDIHSQVY